MRLVQLLSLILVVLVVVALAGEPLDHGWPLNGAVYRTSLGLIPALLGALLLLRYPWRHWLAGMWSFLRSERPPRPAPAPTPNPSPPSSERRPAAAEFRPIDRDLERLLRDLESEHRARDESQVTWTPDALRAILPWRLRR